MEYVIFYIYYHYKIMECTEVTKLFSESETGRQHIKVVVNLS